MISRRLFFVALVLASAAAPLQALETNQFPIAVWLQAPANAERFKAAGINLYGGLWRGPNEQQLAQLKKAGMSLICAQNKVALAHKDDPLIMAWMHDDEPDNAQSDNYIGRGVRRNHPEDYPEYIKGCDIVSFDIYPFMTAPRLPGTWNMLRAVSSAFVNGPGRTRRSGIASSAPISVIPTPRLPPRRYVPRFGCRSSMGRAG